MTPHLLVDTLVPGTVVPQDYIENNRIILNVSPEAVRELLLGNDLITFNARFGGKSCQLSVPISSVIAIYARENGKGLIFEPEENAGNVHEQSEEKTGNSVKNHLKVVK